MFTKVFGFLKQAREIKNTISKLLEIADRLDDDLDKNGQADLKDLLEDLDRLKDEVIASVKVHLVRLKDINTRAGKLVEHVATGK